MNNNVRSLLLKKVAKSVQNADNTSQPKIALNLSTKLNKSTSTYSLVLPIKCRDYNIEDKVQNIMQNDFHDTFDEVTIKGAVISFDMSRNKYTKTVLENNSPGISAPLLDGANKNVIVEFSSPNIAKPFHLGHLRSTIIGNYVSNVNNYVRNRTKKINYLGDWGTQFGFVQLGMELANVGDEEMKDNPIKTLYTAYVAANKSAEMDPSLNDRARDIFNRLEMGDESVSREWERFKSYTIEELRRTYKRIGVVFDEYHWESMYNAKSTKHIIDSIEKMGLLSVDKNDRKVMSLDTKTVPVIKSDGSTLYLTRDIAAAIDRFEKNEFDVMYYVVGNAQTEHFSNLVEALRKMQLPWCDRLRHVKFGTIRGMSTRRGTAVFLDDILNEAKDIVKEKQIQSPTTKVPLDLTDKSADVLAVSAVVIHDLKQRRQKDYAFDWNTIFDMKGDTGVKLQYTHCRLVNLELNCGAVLAFECDPSLLQEPVIDNVITLIGQFEEVVLSSYEQLEPCVLAVYLFRLSNAVNKAMKELRILGEPADLGSQRLLLFHTAKNVLAQGLKLLGITPLDKM